jgi:hypothetical protein
LGFVFGLKESAKHWANHAELAEDYGDWVLKIWRKLHEVRQKRHQSEDIILFAMHWLKSRDFPDRRECLVPWWGALQPLFAAVIAEGGISDCFILLFNLGDGTYNDLIAARELIPLIETFAKRMVLGSKERHIDLDANLSDQGEYNTWRECLRHAVEALEWLRKSDGLRTEFDRERTHGVLSMLAAEPLRISKAVEALHQLQNE